MHTERQPRLLPLRTGAPPHLCTLVVITIHTAAFSHRWKQCAVVIADNVRSPAILSYSPCAQSVESLRACRARARRVSLVTAVRRFRSAVRTPFVKIRLR
ncbi:hypothetical protein Y032_0030g2072 [Ancylostoma ceylanicum]|uniref:Uncharacterized protein n=1 Tax=Ancylostoma ceylanicum TaxID=53326 RepID=A0A016UPZ3_9BILA|nr:hypothetical protein Y032_0030g2072 [Ancylostoma ceylanicum]